MTLWFGLSVRWMALLSALAVTGVSQSVLAAAAADSQPNNSKVQAQIKVTPLPSVGADQAFVLTVPAYGTNIGVFATKQGVVIIDPMPGQPLLPALDKQVRQLTGAPVSIILNTHAHDDHSGGNRYFMQQGATLLTDASQLSGQKSSQISGQISGFVMQVLRSHSQADQVFYHQPSNSIFVGDIYDASWHPTFYAGGVRGLQQAIDAILQLGDAHSLIVPGHGKPGNKTQLQAFKTNTTDWVARVRTLKNAGLNATQIQQDQQLRQILQRFNQQQTDNFVPEKALLRFIERTIAVIDKEAK